MTEFVRATPRTKTEAEQLAIDFPEASYIMESVQGLITYLKTDDAALKTYAQTKGLVVKT